MQKCMSLTNNFTILWPSDSKEQKVVCSIFNGADAESRMVEIEESW